MFKYQPAISLAFQGMATKYQSQLPSEINIKNGQLSTPENKPYLIKEPSTNKPFAIIDASGEYTDMSKVPSDVSILITKDTTYYMDDAKTLKVKKIPDNLTANIKPDQIVQVAGKFVNWLWVLLLPTLLLLSFIYRLLLGLFYAVIGLLLSAFSNAKLQYGTLFKLSIIAMTPAIVLSTIFDWFSVNFRFEWLVCFLLAMIYLTIAINANKE